MLDKKTSMGQNNLWINAGATLVGSIIIAGAIITAGKNFPFQAPLPSAGGGNTVSPEAKDTNNNPAALAQALRPVSSSDHSLGDKNAPVTVIEFSDLQCPYCTRFHQTMQEVFKAYPKKIRWVFRHFPLSSIHPNALPAANAAECAAALKGNEAFWKFIEQVFASQSRLGDDLYLELGKGLNINADKFKTCLSSKQYETKVSQDRAEVEGIGGQGTPLSLVISKGGEITPAEGALPLEQMKKIIDEALKK
jgi:protein-disulfide isomerase